MNTTEQQLFHASPQKLLNKLENWISTKPTELILSYAILKEKHKMNTPEFQDRVNKINHEWDREGNLEQALEKLYKEWEVDSFEALQTKFFSGSYNRKIALERIKSQLESLSMFLVMSWIFLGLSTLYVLVKKSTESASIILLWILFNIVFHLAHQIIKNQGLIIETQFSLHQSE